MSDANTNDEDERPPPREKFKFSFDKDSDDSTSAGHAHGIDEHDDDTQNQDSVDIVKTAVPTTPPAKLSHMLAPDADKDPSTDTPPPKVEHSPARDAAAAADAPMPPPVQEPKQSNQANEPSEQTEETLAGMIAGRRLDTPEAERTFLLTLSRDQRLKYADLLQAGDQLDFDREKQGLEHDRLELERERLQFERSTQYRQNAAILAATALRTLLVTNGLGCLALIAVWGYLSATPAAVFSSEAFLLALSAMGLGAIAGVLTALCAYVTQFLISNQNAGVVSRSAAVLFRVLAVALALTGFGLFIAGIMLAGHGLKSV